MLRALHLLLACAATLLFACSNPLDEPVFETTVALTQVGVPTAVDLRDYLVPNSSNADCTLLEPGSADKDLAQAIQDGQFLVALIEIGPNLINVGGAALNGADGASNSLIVDGVVASEQLRGTLINPLFDALKKMGDDTRASGCVFQGKVLLAIGQGVPFSAVRQVMYSAGQAQFADFAFLSADQEPAQRPNGPPGIHRVNVKLLSGGNVEVTTGPPGSTRTGPSAQFAALLEQVFGGEDLLGCAMLEVESGVPFSDVAAIQLELAKRGVTGLVVGTSEDSPRAATARTTAMPRTWRMADPVLVSGTHLPRIDGPPDPVGPGGCTASGQPGGVAELMAPDSAEAAESIRDLMAPDSAEAAESILDLLQDAAPPSPP
jgi:hypothetical protein